MPRGHRKLTPYVQVLELKGPYMCAMCGRRSRKWKDKGYGKQTLVGHCEDTDKPCSSSARHCKGPFIMEHKVKAKLREWDEE